MIEEEYIVLEDIKDELLMYVGLSNDKDTFTHFEMPDRDIGSLIIRQRKTGDFRKVEWTAIITISGKEMLKVFHEILGSKYKELNAYVPICCLELKYLLLWHTCEKPSNWLTKYELSGNKNYE